MKQYLLLILLFNNLIIFSQPLQVHLSLQSGISVPVMDFASTNLEKGSFALPGFTGSTEIKSILYNNWGAQIQAGLQLNPIDVGYLGYEKVNADPFLEDLYIRSDPFKVIHILAGPTYQYRTGKSFLVEGHIDAGVFFSSTPYQLYKPKFFLIGAEFYEITPSKDISFAYGASLRLIYEVTPCYHIGITNQFTQSKASFQFSNGVNVRTDVRNISLWNTSFSVIIKL